MGPGRQNWEWLDGGHPLERGPVRGGYGFFKLSEDGTGLDFRRVTSQRRILEDRIALRPGMVIVLPTVLKSGELVFG